MWKLPTRGAWHPPARLRAALHLAAMLRRREAAAALIEAGAPQSKSARGLTPMYDAVQAQDREMAVAMAVAEVAQLKARVGGWRGAGGRAGGGVQQLKARGRGRLRRASCDVLSPFMQPQPLPLSLGCGCLEGGGCLADHQLLHWAAAGPCHCPALPLGRGSVLGLGGEGVRGSEGV